jgi:hypothetical protein
MCLKTKEKTTNFNAMYCSLCANGTEYNRAPDFLILSLLAQIEPYCSNVYVGMLRKVHMQYEQLII